MRVILIVLDSVGAGALPDARLYGDEGSNTLVNIQRAIPGMRLENLNALGLSHIRGLEPLSGGKGQPPLAAYGRCAEMSAGKDTTTGHWELAGILTKLPFPTYPNGFPWDIIAAFEEKTGAGVLGNYAASGTEIIQRLGDEHRATGRLILYTSADSVFQLAAHEDIVPVEQLYKYCETARGMLTDGWSVSRVIARPFTGESGDYRRTANRRDFSLPPPEPTILDHIKAAGLETAAVGKIEDIFAGCGITASAHTSNNDEGVTRTLAFMDSVGDGLIFTNLVDFDMLYGHRNNAEGYARALMDFDARLPEILSRLRCDDLLIITADHGCDPTVPGTDHTREYIPLLACGSVIRPVTLGTRSTFGDIGTTVLDYLKISAQNIHGSSFLNEMNEIREGTL